MPASLWALLGRAAWAGKTFKRGDPRALLAVQARSGWWGGVECVV